MKVLMPFGALRSDSINDNRKKMSQKKRNLPPTSITIDTILLGKPRKVLLFHTKRRKSNSFLGHETDLPI